MSAHSSVQIESHVERTWGGHGDPFSRGFTVPEVGDTDSWRQVQLRTAVLPRSQASSATEVAATFLGGEAVAEACPDQPRRRSEGETQKGIFF